MMLAKVGLLRLQKKVSHFEQLQFLLTSRVVCNSSGNITNPRTLEPDNESQQSSGSTQDQERSQEDVAGPSEPNVDLASRRAANDGYNTNAGSSRRGGRSGGRGRGRSITVESEAIAMLQRVDAEDHWDHITYTMAERLGKLPEGRQWSCVPALFEIMALYASPNPIPDNVEVIATIGNLRKKYCCDNMVNTPPPNNTLDNSVQSDNSTPNPRFTNTTEEMWQQQYNAQCSSNPSSYLALLHEPCDEEESHSIVRKVTREFTSPSELTSGQEQRHYQTL
ncbi:uncharacterized protein LOC130284650 [Hyla sarda]|uniref:uncharacterized protein LOC130284650 n=1 Tax=Hyla sarda TaxID=327740 RepID=UPI0024C2D82D|nr:uncharacterized protein LOC130284650 [Hyla sarda]XP_056391178.1 uncharacterized protein LOC130284650 [Hyla sarda]